jgi:hypothetical protein
VNESPQVVVMAQRLDHQIVERNQTGPRQFELNKPVRDSPGS